MAALRRSASDGASRRMPPPPSPSTSGSSVLGKRRRVAPDGSSQGGMDAPVFQRGPTSFSESTKEQIEEANGGENCWCCDTALIQFCHVIPRGSRKMFKDLRRRGLLTIEALHSTANGIALCPTCHVLFDAHDFPGWVFLPTDLQYFVDFEKQDFERREKHYNESGKWPVRLVPSARDYSQHQADLLPQEDIGGIYRRLFFHSRSSTDRVGLRGESTEFPLKQWHGCPLAAIHRTFHSLGSQSHLFPEDIKHQLRELKDLYGHHDHLAGVNVVVRKGSEQGPVEMTATTSTYLPQPVYDTPASIGRVEDQERLGDSQQPGKKRKIDSAQGFDVSRKRARSEFSGRSSQYEPADTHRAKRYAKQHASDKHIPWKWGPSATAEEKITFYKGVYSIGKKPKAGDLVLEQQAASGTAEVKDEGSIAVTSGIEQMVKHEGKEIKASLPSPQASAG
ncbi:MAG: hypothetical protein Q9216_006318 [Gyalolechia sp. 2 TL-2023]